MTASVVLVVGATGSIGRHVVSEAVADLANQQLAAEPPAVRADLAAAGRP